MRTHLDIKTFLILMAVLMLLAVGMARLSTRPSNSEPFDSAQNESGQILGKSSETQQSLHMVFPEKEPEHPLRKRQSSSQPSPTNKPGMPAPPAPTPKPTEKFCIQVVTPAINKQTLEIRQFPTPCDVPEGWKILN